MSNGTTEGNDPTGERPPRMGEALRELEQAAEAVAFGKTAVIASSTETASEIRRLRRALAAVTAVRQRGGRGT